ncbi:hypothetical protein [Halopiger xanaduensis]|uniref:Uncharacterized protein n=1 Tax=Halopiger xanaduensis (strain DSM 18323 / JCM 14033 / SH-6) TaxID=797210 RepID=F8DEH4_HALXS|nr:hypothetical protein [Halopiger xanaduensis]AEH39261.1 hypothetical protein Halxa_0004 [Halopiger xanaduensis SH-6]
MTKHNPHLSRRTALQTVSGAALTSIAGCLNTNGNSGTPSDGSPSSNSQGPLRRVVVDGTTLVVELSEDADVDQVNLIQPNGEPFGQRDVATGAQQVTFELGASYSPGEYHVIALAGEETVEESSLSVHPNLRIMEIGIGKNQPERMWDSSSDKISKEAFVSVENRGNGPDTITQLLFLGDVPYPSDKEGTNYANNEDISGIYDPEKDTEVEEVVIGPGEQLTLYSYRSPFAFVRGDGTSCKSEEQNGEFEVILKTQVGSNQVSETYGIHYSASEEFDNCGITISE